MSITDIIGIPLGALLGWCYQLLGNYGLAIIVFTFLTKVILFPVSMWVQKNGIAMVKLTPDLNRLKIKYYGDKDTIADETQLLYKRENYHPLASTIPMIIQLVMLMGVIGAVKNTMGDADTILTAIPSEAGGLTYLMPLGAGVAALALGLAQNKLNPLQREQGKSEQWMTNGFSIAISLFLGAFVSLGVGIYWICSNLFSILQQIVLNAVIKPEKYIDYEDLAASKKERAAIENVGSGVSKEDKKREKADYKRFFSVANKHLVFYSEKSGFYKYFKDVIDYLLEKSNVIIHYVTSDPKDQIFKIAETQPRIKPYYIGLKKMIPLMMKAEADIIVMTTPDLDKYYIKRSIMKKDIEYVYIPHDMMSVHMGFREGALDAFDTIFCTGPHVVREVRATEEVYGVPQKKLVEFGYPLADKLIEAGEAERASHVSGPRKEILIAPSWQEDNLLDSCIDALIEALYCDDYHLTVRPHPEYVKRYGARMQAITEKYAHLVGDGLTFELDFTVNKSVYSSDLLITDWSGIALEYCFATRRPALFVNTKLKCMNPNWEKINCIPTEISLRDVVGVSVDKEQLSDSRKTVEDLFARADEFEVKIGKVLDEHIFNRGTAAEVGAKYLLASLVEKRKKS